ncbi:MAG: hypothetical protein ACI83N_000853 [Hydrogenophaga sp.]|jgi:hypothetical protein
MSAPSATLASPFASQAPAPRAVLALLALLVLNALLSMTNWWPTPLVKLDARLAPEFAVFWVLLLAIAWRGSRRQPSAPLLKPRTLSALAGVYLLLVLGRYLDTTAPALFARDLTLYWDAPQIVRVVYVTLRSYPLWLAALVVGSVVALLWGLYRLVHWALSRAALDAAPWAVRSPAALFLTALALAASLANFAGVQATWGFVSKPAAPTYLHQAWLLWTSFNERDLHQNLPTSPSFDGDLGLLRGSDVNLVFLESYGQVAFGIPEIDQALRQPRAELQAQVRAAGMEVVSGFMTSTTYGGRSELAHVSFLSGLDTSTPWVHDLLLTTDRPLLTTWFRDRGFDVHALYPALSWDWPERSFYRFGSFFDARDLDYRGPKIGYWSVPDQVTLARYQQQQPITADSPPRVLFFPSITSHLPFHPVPPHLADATLALQDNPFSAAQLAEMAQQEEQWFNMRPAYTEMMRYNHLWVGGWIAQPRVRDAVFIVMGDHQPAANITGPGASWDVPVHIISSKPQLLAHFKAHGFVDGLTPSPKTVGSLFDLTPLLTSTGQPPL